MGEATDTGVLPGRRHIIKRPRLTRLLDESEARVILLVAPAGYGKTTLAREWSDSRPGPVAWYRADHASADAAALALGIAEAVAKVVPGSGDRLRGLLSGGAPQLEAIELAKLLSSELQRWPSEAWLILDNYEVAARSPHVDVFVDTLTRTCPIRALVTTRTRPPWASARRLLYGELYEIGREQLAMDHDEASRVLAIRGQRALPGLVAIARGWPAAISIAAAAPEIEVPEDVLSDAMYDFFAEELFQSLPPRTQSDLFRAVVLPRPNTISLAALLGADRAESLIQTLVETGLAESDGSGQYDFHPLLRAFLEKKASADAHAEIVATAAVTADWLLGQREWDDVFQVIQRWRLDATLVALIEAALRPLLDTGRTATLREWVSYARGLGCSGAVLDLAEAECLFLEGHMAAAEASALKAARSGSSKQVAQQALVRAAQAARFDDRPLDAVRIGRRAREIASTDDERRRALWAQFLAAIDIEDPDAEKILDDFGTLLNESVDEELRLVAGRLICAERWGSFVLPLTQAQAIVHLVDRASDPMITTSFLNAYARGLQLVARYDEAWEMVTRATDEAERSRLTFALPTIRTTQANVALGLRKRRAFEKAVSDAQRSAANDAHLTAVITLLRAQAALAEGQIGAARTLLLATERPPDRGTEGELHAYLALVHAVAGDYDDCHSACKAAQSTTKTGEAAAAVSTSRAVVALRQRNMSAFEDHLGTAVAGGFLSVIVLASRACDDLAPAVYEQARGGRDEIRKASSVIERWKSPARAGDGLGSLSPREREVFALLVRGLTNREIATHLFISDVTVKVHVRHILEKLGVRSRVEAAAFGAGQAAATADESESV